PSMPLVVGYPGFWIANPDTGIDAQRVLHRDQCVELFSPIPMHEEIVGRTSVTSIVDRGKGRGSLLFSSRDIVSARSGALLARVSQTHILRGDDGFGSVAARNPEPTTVPDGEPWAVVDLNTRSEQALLYRLNGDANPLHWSPGVARAAGFDRPILQGMCTFAVVCHALLSATGYAPSRIQSMFMKFCSPAYPGDTLRTEIWGDGHFRTSAVQRAMVVVGEGRYRSPV
ncbi:MAG: MaoC/PaaZ C-terminal domain-containing protein, partial [Desulfobacterales bacterium]|nr:MaoC/PaaZ C-terminal domain-containing protein [Desulfobacterales bacterium]